MRITLISDTHTKHNELKLPGGDLIIHAGDFTSMGYLREIKNFLIWYEKQNYDWKVYIAGNHELGFRDHAAETMELIDFYEEGLNYLEDGTLFIGVNEIWQDSIKIYGSPWQPEFCGWAFNLPRNGWELEQKWNDIPLDTDILITHGPAWGILDTVSEKSNHLGCELLAERLKIIKPKIHVFGHIHGGYGYYFNGTTHFFNAAVLNEQYKYTNKPFTFDWDPRSNEIEFHSVHGRS